MIESEFAKRDSERAGRSSIRDKINSWWIREEHSKLEVNLQTSWGIHNEFYFILKKGIELKVDSCKTEWIHSLFAKIKVNSKLIHERSSDSILKSRIISS